MTLKANIDLNGQFNTISFNTDDRTEVVEEIWEKYGMSTTIIDIWDPEEVADGESSNG